MSRLRLRFNIDIKDAEKAILHYLGKNEVPSEKWNPILNNFLRGFETGWNYCGSEQTRPRILIPFDDINENLKNLLRQRISETNSNEFGRIIGWIIGVIECCPLWVIRAYQKWFTKWDDTLNRFAKGTDKFYLMYRNKLNRLKEIVNPNDLNPQLRNSYNQLIAAYNPKWWNPLSWGY